MKKVVCFFDGCCEPKNPGGAMGTGSIVKIEDKTVYQDSKFYPAAPSNTNNISEYISFGMILSYLLDNGLTGENVIIKGDSQLVVNQMNGQWAIKEGAYRKYALRCRELLSKFETKPAILWIKRDENEEADNLSKGHLAKNNVVVATHSDDPTVINFGKYSGKSVNDIEDLQYLQWALKNVKMKPRFKTVVSERVFQLEFLAK